MEKIEFIIDKTGIRVESSGFSGDVCLKELEKIIAELKNAGISVEIAKQTLKPEIRAKAQKYGVENNVRI